MSSDKNKPGQSIDMSRLLRPQNRLDLILSSDFITGQSDVRSSMILDTSGEAVTVAQTDPPVLKSMTDRVIEASVVHHNMLTYESTRWGWTSRILGLKNDYRLSPKDAASFPVSVIFLSPPPKSGLSKANVRQAYRLDLTGKDILFSLSPSKAKATLVNFSTGGVMVETPAPPAFSLGQELTYSITFPAGDDFPETTVDGEAVVVRMEYEPDHRTARLGLKFQDLKVNSARALQKIINSFMLEEQRKRNRDL